MITKEELIEFVKKHKLRVAEVNIYDYYISSQGVIDSKQAEAILKGKKDIFLVKDISLEEINNIIGNM